MPVTVPQLLAVGGVAERVQPAADEKEEEDAELVIVAAIEGVGEGTFNEGDRPDDEQPKVTGTVTGTQSGTVIVRLRSVMVVAVDEHEIVDPVVGVHADIVPELELVLVLSDGVPLLKVRDGVLEEPALVADIEIEDERADDELEEP